MFHFVSRFDFKKSSYCNICNFVSCFSLSKKFQAFEHDKTLRFSMTTSRWLQRMDYIHRIAKHGSVVVLSRQLLSAASGLVIWDFLGLVRTLIVHCLCPQCWHRKPTKSCSVPKQRKPG